MKALARSAFLNFGIWIDLTIEDRQISELISLLKPKYSDCQMKRFGGRGDGGYLIPDGLEGIGGCISPGVSAECSFDTQIADLGSCRCIRFCSAGLS